MEFAIQMGLAPAMKDIVVSRVGIARTVTYAGKILSAFVMCVITQTRVDESVVNATMCTSTMVSAQVYVDMHVHVQSVSQAEIVTSVTMDLLSFQPVVTTLAYQIRVADVVPVLLLMVHALVLLGMLEHTANFPWP